MADLRERVARAIADEPDTWPEWLPEADAVLAELGLTQAEPRTPIENLMAQYTNDGCDFTDMAFVRAASLRYVKTMPDSQVRCLLYALAAAPQPQPQAEPVAWYLPALMDLSAIVQINKPTGEDGWLPLFASPQADTTGTQPVLTVEREPDYWSGGHFYTGRRPHINPLKVQSLPIGTKLYAAPQPQPQPQPQASAEDVALVDGVIRRHVEWHAPVGVTQAWQRIRASLGVSA